MNDASRDPVVYEVNFDVESALAQEYRAWLDTHVDAMLALPGFVSAQVFEVLEPVEAERTRWCVHYLLRDPASLDGYLHGHAASMRADGQRRFGARFSASRRVLRAG